MTIMNIEVRISIVTKQISKHNINQDINQGINIQWKIVESMNHSFQGNNKINLNQILKSMLCTS